MVAVRPALLGVSEPVVLGAHRAPRLAARPSGVLALHRYDSLTLLAARLLISGSGAYTGMSAVGQR